MQKLRMMLSRLLGRLSRWIGDERSVAASPSRVDAFIHATAFGKRRRFRLVGMRGYHVAAEEVDGLCVILLSESNIDPNDLDVFRAFRAHWSQ
jgi:hypothetical protein